MTQGPSATQGVSASHWQCTFPKVLLVAGWMSGEKAPLFIFSCCISSCAFLLKPSFVMLSSCCNIKRNCQIIWRFENGDIFLFTSSSSISVSPLCNHLCRGQGQPFRQEFCLLLNKIGLGPGLPCSPQAPPSSWGTAALCSLCWRRQVLRP